MHFQDIYSSIHTQSRCTNLFHYFWTKTCNTVGIICSGCTHSQYCSKDSSRRTGQFGCDYEDSYCYLCPKYVSCQHQHTMFLFKRKSGHSFSVSTKRERDLFTGYDLNRSNVYRHIFASC